MSVDPPMEDGADRRDRAARGRRRLVVKAGHEGSSGPVLAVAQDADPGVRVARLGALARLGTLDVAQLTEALADPDARVRRRAATLGAKVGGKGSRSALPALLEARLGDPEPLVVEAAAWALGERRVRASVPTLATVAADHDDPRCREAAIAALGAIGDPLGLAAVLHGLEDRPAVRRRAVVALAGFESPEVESALRGALEDPDWQVRQAAEVLLGR